MGTDSGSSYRAEARSSDNEVKGVYSWLDSLGHAHTTAFNSGKNGYQTMPLAKSGIILPPFPYSLYGAPRPQSRENDFIAIGAPEDVLVEEIENEIVEDFETGGAEVIESTGNRFSEFKIPNTRWYFFV